MVRERQAVPVLRGNLGLGTLPALIEQLYRENASGTLKVTLSAITRRLYFLDGQIVFANSEQLDDRLGGRLVREGAIDEDTLEQATRLQRESGERIGQTLIGMGKLTDEAVMRAVEVQVRDIVQFAFALHCGDYAFEYASDPVDADLIIQLPMEEVILDGIRAIDDPIAIRVGVGALTDTLVPLVICPAGIELNEDESFVLSRLDSRPSILDILSQAHVAHMEETRTLRAVCALLAVGIVVSESAPTPKRLDLGEETQPVPLVAKLNAVKESSSHVPLSDAQRNRAASRLFQEGRRLFEGGRFHDSISALQEAVRLNDTHASYVALLGQAMGKNPHWTDFAIDYLERALELDALDVETHWQLALMYERKPERRKDAEELHRMILSLDPKHAGARSKLPDELNDEANDELPVELDAELDTERDDLLSEQVLADPIMNGE